MQNINPLAQYDVSDNVYNTYRSNIVPQAAREAFWKGAATSCVASIISKELYTSQLGGMFTGYQQGNKRANEIASNLFRNTHISAEAEGALKTNLSHNL